MENMEYLIINMDVRLITTQLRHRDQGCHSYTRDAVITSLLRWVHGGVLASEAMDGKAG
jgi:hypothetical protein